MKTIILVLSMILLAGCGKKEPARHYNYTVWVGGAGFASGYDTDEYKLTGDTVTFKKKDGKEMIVPVCGLFSIEEN